MPSYSYRAVRQTGELVSGTMLADSENTALNQLRQQSLLPISISLDANTAGASGLPMNRGGRRRRSGRLGAEEVLFFTGKLALLLGSGLPLLKALAVIRGMGDNAKMSMVIQDLIDSVKAGQPFSEALSAHQRLFGSLYVSMVKAGEQGGNLSEVLQELGQHLERAKLLRNSIISAMIYPSILAFVAVLSVGLLLGFVVPRFEVLFNNMGQALPLPTQIVVALGHATARYGWLVVLSAAILFVLGYRALQQPTYRLQWDRFLLRLPIIGSLTLKYETTLFSRTLGTLLRNGVPLIRSVPIALETLSNSAVKQAISGIQLEIKEGVRLSDTLERSGVFTDLGVQMVRVGEESGRVDELLIDLARVYDADVQELIKRGLALLEPVLILALGTVIGGIITAILLGILSVNNLAN